MHSENEILLGGKCDETSVPCCFFVVALFGDDRDGPVCPRVNNERSAAGPLALPAAPRWGQ